MFSYFKVTTCILCATVLFSCTTQELSEEEYRKDTDGYISGPGFLTGDKGGFTLNEVFGDGDKKRLNADGTYATSSDVNVPAIDQQSFEDFENFKAWRRAQDPESPNYQEYQDWRAYQQYRRFKAQQPEEAAKP